MKKMMLTLLTLALFSGPAWAQSPSAELTPSERQRYGSTLWEVPREPYQRGYKFEEFNSRLYNPDPLKIRSSSPLVTAAPSLPGQPATRAQRRFQDHMTWQNEQRKISRRSRVRAPSAPLQTSPPGQPHRPAWQPAGRP